MDLLDGLLGPVTALLESITTSLTSILEGLLGGLGG